MRTALALGVALVFVAGCSAATSSSRRAEGTEVPDLRMRTIDGESLRLADHLGSDVVVLSFWATWCKPCKTELPFLQRLHETYAARGLTVIGISLDGPETQADVKPFVRRNGYTFPIVLDRDGRIAARLNPRSTAPFALIFDRAGRRHRTMEGFQLGERDAIEAEVVSLLDAAPEPAPSVPEDTTGE